MLSPIDILILHTNNCKQCKKALQGRFCGLTTEEIHKKRCNLGEQIARKVFKENSGE